MKHLTFIFALLCLSSLPGRVCCQIGNNDGRFNEIIKQAYVILDDIKAERKKSIVSKYKYSGFQEKDEFLHFVKKKNLSWAKQAIDTFGTPRKEEVSISEWRTSSKENETHETTVNLTFFFKRAGEKFSNINDHISLNFQRDSNGSYYLDGMMFFKKNDYVAIKRIIEEMP